MMRTAKQNMIREWERAQVAKAAYFVACLFQGRGRYDKRTFPTLAEARAEAATMGDEYGRHALVYAVVPGTGSVHVPEDL